MLYDNFTDEDLRIETQRVCRALCAATDPHRPLPRIEVRRTRASYTTGLANSLKIILRVPRDASVPQALALICHEVAHWMEPAHGHNETWRRAFARGLRLYGVEEIDMGGHRYLDVHPRARQAIAARLRLQQHAKPAEPLGPSGQYAGTDKRERVCRKIAKLLALAERAGSEAEAHAAASRATQLLHEYRLSLEDVQEQEREASDPLIERSVSTGSSRRVAWHQIVASGVGNAFGVFALSYSSRRRGCYFRLFGRRSAVEIAEYTILFALREIEKLGAEAAARFIPTQRESRRAHAASWRRGAASGFCSALEARQAAKDTEEASREAAENTTRALALLRTDRERAEAFASSKTTWGSGRGCQGGLRGSGFLDGWKAGKSLHPSTGIASLGGTKQIGG